VTSLVTERLAEPDTARRARALECARRRAADELAGRTVWCLAAARTGAAAASALQDCLRGVRADGVAARRARVPVPEPLGRLVERLDEMLRGELRSSSWLGPEAREVYLQGAEEAERLIGHEVHPGDLVVLHDPAAGALAEAVRCRGAHAVWRVTLGPRSSTALQAWRSLHRRRPCLDAYITDWPPRGIAAFISAPGRVSAKEVRAGGQSQSLDELGWTSLLADVVAGDRDETVGGNLHARPSVAAR
jgi:hypothetical protein